MQELKAAYCDKHNEWFFLKSWQNEKELIYRCHGCMRENEKFNLVLIGMKTREEVREMIKNDSLHISV